MVRYLLEWMDEEEDEGEFQSEALLCHPLCQCPTCAPTQKLSVMQAGTLGVNSCNIDGFTPLHVAALHGHSALAALLIRHGASVNARTNQSATPLHLASQNSHIQCVKALVYYDVQTCRLDLQNDKGDTALHMAARWGYEGIIQVLLENGANTDILNKNKDSPLQCALNSKVHGEGRENPFRRRSSSRLLDPLVLALVQHVPGVGRVKATALLQQFSSIQQLCNAAPAEIEPIVGQAAARQIHSFFHKPTAAGT